MNNTNNAQAQRAAQKKVGSIPARWRGLVRSGAVRVREMGWVVQMPAWPRRYGAAVAGWIWQHREGAAAIICYGLLYGLALAIHSRDPVVIGAVAFCAAIAAIVGHCLSEISHPET